MSTLVRTKATKLVNEKLDKDILDLDAQLAEDAVNYLGYWGLKTDLVKSNKSTVAKTLEELNIDVFTTASVDKYKAKMLAKLERRKWLPAAAIIGVIGGALAFFGGIVGILLTWADAAGWVAAGSGVFALACAYALSFIGNRLEESNAWRLDSLSGYRKRIPEYAIETAVQVKKAIPNCPLYVDHLTTEIVKDPFLVLVDRTNQEEQRYYLEVWNEPAYKAVKEMV